MSVTTLTREELHEALEVLELYPEVAGYLDNYLAQYIHTKDLKMVTMLLKAGGNPNPEKNLDCYLHYLLHEYQVTKTTSGELVLALMEVLLQGGADPNRPWSNNWRAYDYAVSQSVEPITKLLLKYGASPETREYL